MRPSIIWIDPQAVNLPLAREARAFYRQAETVVAEQMPAEVFRKISPSRILRITTFAPPAIRPLREGERSAEGRPEGYIAFGAGCPAGCKYCVLKICCPVKVPTLYGDWESLLADLKRGLEGGEKWYLHLGHIYDPLAYEVSITFLNELISLFKSFPSVDLEIRTKFARPEAFSATPQPNVLPSFSLSPSQVARCVEVGTPSLKARLSAAKQLVKRGWKIGIRIDPILVYPGWERDYDELCKLIVQSLPQAGVRDVVLGVFRGPAQLMEEIFKNDPDPFFSSGEFVPVGSGKYSYPRPIRVRSLRFLATRLGGYFAVRFCFDRYDVEEAVFSRPPG